jgi:soluble lytic murein transglycosylase-like protein
MGLMQLMPATAADMGVWDPYDPEQDIRGGVAYLRHLLNRFDGNEELAPAAYKASPEAVARHGNHVPPYRETRNYLDRVRSSTTVTNRRLVAARVNGQTIYKTYEVVDGRRIRSYSDVPPVQRRATTVPAPAP